MEPAVFILGSYLVGAIPFGLCLGKWLRGVDLRDRGSKNIGATNAWRVLGRGIGLTVFLLDFAKGAGPVMVAQTLGPTERLPEGVLALLCGAAAILGHIFPVYLGFRGGKGVATAGGAFLVLNPLATGASLLTWLALLAMFRMVALASLGAAWVFPLVFWYSRGRAGGVADLTLLAASTAMALLITLRHRTNLARMFRGEEPRVG